MSVQIGRQTYTYRDARGHTGKVSFYISNDNAVAGDGDAANAIGRTVEAEITALTNAVLVGASGPDGRTVAPNQYGASLQYATAEDKLRLRLLAADNTIHTMAIPSPKLSAFEADQETLKGSAVTALVATLVAAAITGSFACTRAGSPFVSSLGGQLVRRKFQRKLTIYDKSANLDEPED
jgi:hypothetical protein